MLVLFTGISCSKSPEQANPSPHSSYTYERAREMANLVSITTPGSRIGGVAPTGSMLPTFDSKSWLIWEQLPPLAELGVGDVISADEGLIYNGQPTLVCHAIEKIDLKNQAVWIAGVNNTWPDGWIPYSKLHGRLAGIIYSQRAP